MGVAKRNALSNAISDIEKIMFNISLHKEDIEHLRRETLRTGNTKLLKKLIRREKGVLYFKNILNDRLLRIRLLAN